MNAKQTTKALRRTESHEPEVVIVEVILVGDRSCYHRMVMGSGSSTFRVPEEYMMRRRIQE